MTVFYYILCFNIGYYRYYPDSKTSKTTLSKTCQKCRYLSTTSCRDGDKFG